MYNPGTIKQTRLMNFMYERKCQEYSKVFDIKERGHVPAHITHTTGRSVYGV